MSNWHPLNAQNRSHHLAINGLLHLWGWGHHLFCAHHDIVSLHFRLFLNQFFTLELQAEKKNDTVTNFLYLIEKLRKKGIWWCVVHSFLTNTECEVCCL